MSLELLPNEVLLDLFDYFDGTELLCTFYGLNFRFNIVLHERFRTCSIKFNSVSKRDFDVICGQHLPLMSNYIVDLGLSDHEETPTQIKTFISYIPSFNRLNHLKSLSLFNLRSYQTLKTIIEGCYLISNLTHLNLINCYFQETQANLQLIVNHIWSLPSLIHCKISIGIKGQSLFCTPTKLSSSLKHVFLEKIQMKLNQIDQLVEYTPDLQRLSISITSFLDNDYKPSCLTTLLDLSVNSVFICNASNIDVLLKNTPNLRRLSIDLPSEIVDGNRWEEIIHNYLPELKVLKLKMKLNLATGQNIQQRVDELIDSFQSSFWIYEHQWYIRCFTSNRTIYLYTLSHCYDGSFPVTFRSTYPLDNQESFYNNITKIISPTFFDLPISPNIRLTKLNHLCINLPINDQFWSVVSTINRLKSIEIHYHANIFQSQVQALLDRTPYLYTLSIYQHESMSLQTALFKYSNSSVRELDLRNINHYFNEEDCIKLSQSPLGTQCEKLSILVHSYQSIISLVNHMKKLRALNVKCKDENYIESITSSEENDMESCDNDRENKDISIYRLKSHLPSRCVIVRDPKLTCNLLLWV